jgi:glutathione S-transferase
VSAVQLFGLERSAYTRIARLALEEKGVPYVLNEVEIFGPDGVPAVHWLRHPFGRIPVLNDGGFELYETSAITRYVDEAFAGPSLQPRNPHARARMNQIIGLLDAYAYRSMVWGVFVRRCCCPVAGGVVDEDALADSLLSANTCLLALDRLAQFSPFLLGDAVSLADLHAFPMLRYLSLAAEGRDLLAEHPRIQAWLERCCVRPSVQRTRGRYELAAQNASEMAKAELRTES